MQLEALRPDVADTHAERVHFYICHEMQIGPAAMGEGLGSDMMSPSRLNIPYDSSPYALRPLRTQAVCGPADNSFVFSIFNIVRLLTADDCRLFISVIRNGFRRQFTGSVLT